jgi:hypothetical protein
LGVLRTPKTPRFPLLFETIQEIAHTDSVSLSQEL